MGQLPDQALKQGVWTMTIIVVDDEADFRMLMRSMLLSEGFDVIVAENGAEAIEKLKGSKIDLVISDIYMPVMDGRKFHKAVRAMPEFERTPFLFISGYDDQHTHNTVKDPRIEGFFRKGSPKRELMEWIEFLTTPEALRPKLRPGSAKLSE
jgi:CheY-like chemotaxis protein